jgi:hypothetical protein
VQEVSGKDGGFEVPACGPVSEKSQVKGENIFQREKERKSIRGYERGDRTTEKQGELKAYATPAP